MVAAPNMIKFRKNEPSRASRHQFLQTPPVIQAHIVSIPVPTRMAVSAASLYLDVVAE